MVNLNFGTVSGLPPDEQQWLNELQKTFTYYQTSNAVKQRYYEGDVTLQEINLGIALPYGLQ